MVQKHIIIPNNKRNYSLSEHFGVGDKILENFQKALEFLCIHANL